MFYKTIQNTKISAIGQGTMGIGGYFTKDDSHDGVFIDIIRKNIDYGINLIDTSELYGGGYTEELIGKAIANRRKEVFIVTKVAPQNLHFDDVIYSVERSLRKLKTDVIDMCQIHWPNPSIPHEETLHAIDKLIEQGKIRSFGVSNFLLKELKIIEKIFTKKLFSVQAEYSLFNRFIEEDLLTYAQNKDMLIMAYSPFRSGKMKDLNLLNNIAEKHRCSQHQIALSWLMHKKNVVPIVKSGSITHLQENVNATKIILTKKELKYIDITFANKCVKIDTRKIICDNKGLETFVPSADVLAKSIKNGIMIKPVVIKKIDEDTYQLLEGKVRYWAWVLAYKNKKPINTLIF